MVDLAASVAKDLGNTAALVLDTYYSDGTFFGKASPYKDDH